MSDTDKHAPLDQIESIRARLDAVPSSTPSPAAAEPEEGAAAALCHALRRFAQRLEEV